MKKEGVKIETKVKKGYVIEGYVLEDMVGAGGFSTVYKASRIKESSPYAPVIAVKVLHPRRFERRQIRMFKEEIKALMFLQHPNIVKVYALKTQDGHYFALMEFIDSDLLKMIRAKPSIFNQQNVLEIIKQAASGLSFIHKNGFVHKDINPANILVSHSLDKIRISDFGLAGKKRLFNKEKNLSGGTEGYIAPELKQGFAGDVKTDIYSLGRTIHKIYSELMFEIPDKVKYVIEVSTNPDREERFVDMKELLFFLGERYQ